MCLIRKEWGEMASMNGRVSRLSENEMERIEIFWRKKLIRLKRELSF